MNLAIVCVLSAISIGALAAHAAEPRREFGLSAHMLPKRVAALDKSGRTKWGFTVSVPGDDRARSTSRRLNLQKP
jgi:hypothetical protein